MMERAVSSPRARSSWRPAAAGTRNNDFIHAPPQRIRFFSPEGLHLRPFVYGLTQTRNLGTMRREYAVDPAVSVTLSVPGMIRGETALSFLGLRAPVVSWGVLLQDAQNFRAVAIHPWLLFPALAVIITVLMFNFLGDGLRDADPYKR